VSNYTIVAMGHGRGKQAKAIRVGSAVLNPVTNTVLLAPTARLDVHKTYVFTINGATASGVCGLDGALLNAEGVGKPGSDYVATINRKTLAGPDNAVPSAILNLAGKGHATQATSTQGTSTLSHRAVDHVLASGGLHRRARRPGR
jgi:hypothetical protein